MNSDFIIKRVIYVCFSKAQETTPPLKINTHLKVDLLSPALRIRLGIDITFKYNWKIIII
jgi:hypothetical protein